MNPDSMEKMGVPEDVRSQLNLEENLHNSSIIGSIKGSFRSYMRENALVQRLYKLILLIVLLASATAFIWMALHPETLKKGLEIVKHLGIWGNVILVGCYIIISFPVAVGYTAVGLACGFLYGPFWGVLTTFIGAQVLGSSISFWLCGSLCKEWVEKKVKENKKADAILKAVRKNGFKIIIMSRLTPVPFGIQNALFGVSGIRFYSYIIATWIGMLPEAFLWCYFGSKAREINDVLHGQENFGAWQKVILAVEVISATLLVTVLGFLGRRAMRKAIQEQEQEQRQNLLTQLEETEQTGDYDDDGDDIPPENQTEPTLIIVQRPE